MKKEQYKAVIRALKKQQSGRGQKLIHRLINYRSHNEGRYPKQFIKYAIEIKNGIILFDSMGIWYFTLLEGDDRWRQPNFEANRLTYSRPIESDLPF